MVKRPRPGNPLWIEFVEDWIQVAEAKGSKAADGYKKALYSLKACPIEFSHPEEAVALSGIGPKIVARLLGDMKAHCARTGMEMPERGEGRVAGPSKRKRKGVLDSDEERAIEATRDARRNRTKGIVDAGAAPGPNPRADGLSDGEDDEDQAQKGPAKKARTTKAYVPKKGSGSYAILVALYSLCSYDDAERWSLKTEIINVAADYSTTPFDKGSAKRGGEVELAGGFYSAWSGMKTLVEKELVSHDNRSPRRWALTAAGYTLSEKLAKAAGIVGHVRGPSSSSSHGGMIAARARGPVAGPSRQRRQPLEFGLDAFDDDDEEEDANMNVDPAEAQYLRDLALATRLSQSETGRAPPAPAPRQRGPLPIPLPKPREAAHPSSGSSRASMGDMNGRKAATGLYARHAIEKPAPAPTMGVDSWFGYYYLNEIDERVMKRDQAEVGQEDGSRDPIFRIEYRTAQDLHSMARSVLRQSSLVRNDPLPGGVTKSGYLRLRNSNETAPGFPDKVGKAAVAPLAPVVDKDPMSSLMGGYRPPPKKDKDAMYAAPVDVRRSGPDHSAPAARPAAPIASGSTSATSKATLAPAPRPQAASTSRTVTPIAPPARSASVLSYTTSSTVPLAVSYNPAPGQTDVERHPLMAWRAPAPLSSYNFPSSIVPNVLQPGTFKVVLIIDTREMGGKTSRTEFVEKLSNQGVNVDRRMLPLGDMIWVARPHNSRGEPMPNADVVLDYIVERKRLDDLCSSIIDGRYTSQKIRMKQSGISQRIYLIEKYDTAAQYAQFGKQIWTSRSQLQLFDGFFVHESSNFTDTIKFLRQRTQKLINLHEVCSSLSSSYPHTTTDGVPPPSLQNKPLYVIPDQLIERSSYLALQEHLTLSQPTRSFLTTYGSFESLNKVGANLSHGNVWASMIQTVSGVSAEKAGQLIQRWPTALPFFRESEEYKFQIDEENQRLKSQSMTGKPPKKKNAEDFAVEKLGPTTLLRGVKGKLGAKIFHMFHPGGENAED